MSPATRMPGHHHVTTDRTHGMETAPVAASLTPVGAGRWRIDGDLCLAQVAGLAAQAAPMADARQVALDLGGVGRASSAAVALLLEWQARLRACGAGLRLVNAPVSLCRLAALSNVDGLLGLAEADATAGDSATAHGPG